jgi:hypothetical protein
MFQRGLQPSRQIHLLETSTSKVMTEFFSLRYVYLAGPASKSLVNFVSKYTSDESTVEILELEEGQHQ